MSPEEPARHSGQCAHPQCAETTDEEGYCHGCKSYLCEKHDDGRMHGVGHTPEDHWRSL